MEEITKKELSDYEEARIQYRDCDYKNSVNTARKEGHEEGLKEGREEGERNKAIEIAKEMKKDGFPIDKISKLTGLTEKEITVKK